MQISGVLGSSSAVANRERDGWGAQLDLIIWQIDDGPIERGRLLVRPRHYDLERVEAEAVVTGLTPDSLVSFDAQLGDHNQWESLEILEAPLPSNELTLLHQAHAHIPPATEPWHYAALGATCTLSGEDGGAEEWAERASADVTEPWKATNDTFLRLRGFLRHQPVPSGHFGGSRGVQLIWKLDGNRVVVNELSEEAVERGHLEAFMNAHGSAIASELGLDVSFTPSHAILAAGHRREPIDLPSGRRLMPRDIGTTVGGGMKVSDRGYWTDVLAPGALAGRKVRFSWHKPKGPPKEMTLTRIDEALTNFMAADPSIVEAAQSLLYSYYENIAEEIGRDGVPEISEPSEVWSHVEFSDLLRIQSLGDSSAQIVLEGACSWYSHGLRVTFDAGQVAIEAREA